MWLVTAALRRPITVLVLVMAAILTGLMAIERMPRDVFPTLGVPVLYVAQPYGGMDPAQMEGFLVNYYEYHFLYIKREFCFPGRPRFFGLTVPSSLGTSESSRRCPGVGLARPI